MEYLTFKNQQDESAAQVSCFKVEGGAAEYHLCVTPPYAPSFELELSELEKFYCSTLGELGLSDETAVFRRLFVSDYANQEDLLKRSPLVSSTQKAGPVAVSIVEQPPLPERRVALWAYHIRDVEALNKVKEKNGMVIHRPGLSHLWLTSLRSTEESQDDKSSAYLQTQRILQDLCSRLKQCNGATLEDNLIRTWIFVQNIDRNYGGMVQSRREFFARSGLTSSTHYIASTGIEGRHADHRSFVILDAYAIVGIQQGQVDYLSAPDFLGPTHQYGVTFERGTRVSYGDRCHVLISGTASINNEGEVLHPGDVSAQTDRTVQNIRALLDSVGVVSNDIASMVVYVRDSADRLPVQNFLKSHYPEIPYIIARGSVCRPSWLVEIECIAVIPAHNPDWQTF